MTPGPVLRDPPNPGEDWEKGAQGTGGGGESVQGQALGAEGGSVPPESTLRALGVWCHNMGQPRRSECRGPCQLPSSRKPALPTRASLQICLTGGCLSPLPSPWGWGGGRSDSALCLSMEPSGVAGLGRVTMLRGGRSLSESRQDSIPASAPKGQPQLLTGFRSQGNHVPFY